MAKAKKTKIIPKRIAGVKLPKELRRTGEAILEKANSPAGREMLAAGLTMAATAAATAVARSRAAGAASEPNPEEAGKPGTPDPMALANTLGGMAEVALGKFFAKRS